MYKRPFKCLEDLECDPFIQASFTGVENGYEYLCGGAGQRSMYRLFT